MFVQVLSYKTCQGLPWPDRSYLAQHASKPPTHTLHLRTRSADDGDIKSKISFCNCDKKQLVRIGTGTEMHLASSFEMCGAAKQAVGLAGCGCLTACECPWPKTSICPWHPLFVVGGLFIALNLLAPFSSDLGEGVGKGELLWSGPGQTLSSYLWVS